MVIENLQDKNIVKIIFTSLFDNRFFFLKEYHTVLIFHEIHFWWSNTNGQMTKVKFNRDQYKITCLDYTQKGQVNE